MRIRATLLAVLAVAGLALTGCDHGSAAAAPAGAGDRIGSLEASVDAIAGQVNSDGAG